MSASAPTPVPFVFPPNVVLSFDFSAWQAPRPTQPLPGDQLDGQLNVLAQAHNDLLAFIRPAFNDDGGIANGSIGLEQLDPDVRSKLAEGAIDSANAAATAAAMSAQQAEAAASAAASSAGASLTSSNLAHDWAEKVDGPVVAEDLAYSAKYWAARAQSIATGNLTVLQLTDTPNGYGTPGQALQVNPARDGLVWGNFLPLAGGDLSGNLTIRKATPRLILRSTTDYQGHMIAAHSAAGQLRWQMALGDTADSCDFALDRYDNAGQRLGTPLHINRLDGATTFAGAAHTFLGADATPGSASCTIDGNLTTNGAAVVKGALRADSNVEIAGNLGVGVVVARDVIVRTSGDAALTLDRAAGARISAINGMVDGKLRWSLQVANGGAETGQNQGSNFGIYRYDDHGNYMGTGLEIERRTGTATFGGEIRTGANIYAGALRGGWGDAGVLHARHSDNWISFFWDGQGFGCDLNNGSSTSYLIRSPNLRYMDSREWGGHWSLLVQQIDGGNCVIHYDVVSDERLKTNIAPSAEDALAKLLSLDVVQFDWSPELREAAPDRAAYDQHVDLGLIAQQIRDRVHPSLVGAGPLREGGDDYLTPNLKAMVPWLVKAVQQLAARVEALEASPGGVGRATPKAP